MDNELPHALERDALCKLCAILNEFDADAKERILTWVAWPLEMDRPLRQLRPLSSLRGLVEELLAARAERDKAVADVQHTDLALRHLTQQYDEAVRQRDAAVAEAAPPSSPDGVPG